MLLLNHKKRWSNYIFIIIGIVLGILFCFIQNREIVTPDLIEWQLKGKIKSVNQTLYQAVGKFGSAEKNDLMFRTLLIFDEKECLREKIFYDSKEFLIEKTIYKYDEEGNKKEFETFNSEGKLTKKYIYSYNAEGIKTEGVLYDSVGKFIYKDIFNYQNGKMLEYIQQDAHEKTIMREHYTYFEEVYDTGKDYYLENGDAAYEYNRYSINGLRLETGIRQNNRLTTTKYNYEFDKKGNWIKQTLIMDQENYYLVEREIEYY